jgi:galactose oxidase
MHDHSHNAHRVCAEMWDPATGTWSQLAEIAVPRTYHSVALLLPDGRVFNGGGGLCGGCSTNHLNGQIFTPPMLLTSSGGVAPRPTISVSSTSLTNGGTFTVTSSVRLRTVAILRLGTATHAVNNDQRRIELCGPAKTACATGTTNTLTAPADPGIALPGVLRKCQRSGCGD